MKKICFFICFFYILLFNIEVYANLNNVKERKSTIILEMINPRSLINYYENEYYKANLFDFEKTAEHTFSDKTFQDSTITITHGTHGMPITILNYEDLYNEDSLLEIKNSLLEKYNNSYNLNTICKESYISDFGKYKSFYFLFQLAVSNNDFYYIWGNLIYTDNYVVSILINSSDINYINSNNIRNFINSFEIKDTTEIYNLTAENPQTTNTNTFSETDLPYANYTTKNLIASLIFTAIVYLFVPIAIRLIHKNGFESGTAFWISLFNFVMIKIILSVLLDANLNITSAWWYLFIGQAILTLKYKDKGNPYSKPLDEIIKDISNKEN